MPTAMAIKSDDYRPDAWRYRDYVIAAFNDDKPYDRFLSEQLAGDELFPDNPEALVATGYLRHWIYEYNNRDAAGQWTMILNDITDTTADVFMGLGLQCARCHDHKFDPLLQADYYRLQAFFAPLEPRDGTRRPDQPSSGTSARQEKWEHGKPPPDVRQRIAEIQAPALENCARKALSHVSRRKPRLCWQNPPRTAARRKQQLADLAWRQVTL